MLQRIETKGSRPATAKDGIPTVEQLITAYDVPAHRRAAVSRELARYGSGRDLTGGILASVKVSASREGGRGLKDRLRRISGSAGVAGLIDSGRALLVINEGGVEGALAIGAMMMTSKSSIAMEGFDALALRVLGQQVIDSCVAGSEEADTDRDDAHTYATLIDVLNRDGTKCDEEREILAAFQAMCDLVSIDHLAAARFMMAVVEKVEANGPWVDVAAEAGGDLVDRILLQLELTALFEQLSIDPAVLATIAQRRDDHRAITAAKRRSEREVAARIEPPPLLPGLV